MLILGIDPGSIITGYGLVRKQGSRLLHLDNGGIFSPKSAEFPKRIHHIYREIIRLIATFKPEAVAVENIFMAKNAQSALKLGHARGAIMVAALEAGLPLHEYGANQVKLAVTGYGHASKEQMQKMVQVLLKLPEAAFTDATDALGVAICHLNTYRPSLSPTSQS